jgi:hypothetical protein
MRAFKFEALDANGEECRGTLHAASEEDAAERIRQAGYFVFKLSEVGRTDAKRASFFDWLLPWRKATSPSAAGLARNDPPAASEGEPALSMELRAHAAYYWSHPPRCIAGFTATPAALPGVVFDGHASVPPVPVPGVVIEGADHLNTVFLLTCVCGHDRHFVLGYHWRNPDFSNESVFLSPLSLRCASCGKETELIDTDRHGYDAELGGVVATALGEGERGEYRCDWCGVLPFQVCVRFENSADVFTRDFEEFRGREQDLFSWFSAVGRCSGCSRLLAIADFECA